MALLKDRDLARLNATDRKPLFDTYPSLGTARDFARRIRLTLPQGWFPPYRDADQEEAPVLQALLTGAGSVLAYIWQLMNYVREQTRIGTTTDLFLDMAARDFCGAAGVQRMPLEKDTHLRRRIVTSLLTEKATRAAVSEAVVRVCGILPRIIEPGSVCDCGAWSRRGGYGAGQSRYGAIGGGFFFMEMTGSLPVARREIDAALCSVKAAGVVAWVRMQD